MRQRIRCPVKIIIGYVSQGNLIIEGIWEQPHIAINIHNTCTIFSLRFMTDDFTPDIYTSEGLKWIQDTDMRSVIIRVFPEIKWLSNVLKNAENAFFPWPV